MVEMDWKTNMAGWHRWIYAVLGGALTAYGATVENWRVATLSAGIILLVEAASGT